MSWGTMSVRVQMGLLLDSRPLYLMAKSMRVEHIYDCDSHVFQQYILSSGIADIRGVLICPKMASAGHPAMLEAWSAHFCVDL